jgi:type IV pilus assembly protein PilA
MPRSGRTRAEHGFTLVEVLVVVLIIATLAAIAIPAFLNQRARAQDADAKTSVATAAKAMEIWRTEHDSFAPVTPATLADIEPSLGHAASLAIVDATADTYEIVVASRSGGGGGGPFRIKRTANGATERLCDGRGRGACSDDGTW